ncbi:MAG TPA: ABC transporter ATP-binding protein [Edaphobacter sp.]|nr:ABC transporter ATP-binding protein [Edaphobacter sp.]
MSSHSSTLPSSANPDPANPPIIVARDLGKTYRSGKLEVQALRNVNFAVAPGEFVAIVGPSGSGKSTLFYILGGLTNATTGSVLIDGTDFARLSDAERTRMRRAKIGFIFQRFNLLPTLSAMGNIEISHDISNLGTHTKKELDKPLLDHLTDMLGIQGRLEHRPNELSGGEQQRVAIARALINRPAIVLADEPTGNLDTRNSEAVLNMLRQSSRELNQTVLMITHNPEAAQIADRILHMRDGEITHIEEGKG